MPSGSLWDSVAMDENRNCQKSKKHPVRHTCKPDFNLWAAEILGSDAPGLSWPPKASLRSWGQSSTMPWEKGTWQSCPMAPVFSASSCLAQGFMPWLGSRNCVSNAFFFKAFYLKTHTIWYPKSKVHSVLNVTLMQASHFSQVEVGEVICFKSGLGNCY